MGKHTITTSRRRTTAVTRRRQTRTPTRRRPAPLARQARRLVCWHLKRGIVRPRLITLVLLLIWGAALWLGIAHLLHAWPLAQAATVPSGQSARPTHTPVSSSIASRVPALYQGDPSIGWDSSEQYHAWWPSACAPAALTEMLRAWGTNVGIGPVLDRLIADQAISVEGGLLDANALAAVARSYGDQAETFWQWSQVQVAQVTSQGVPVLVDVVDAQRQTPYSAFVTGHWLVVVSVSPPQIAVRDSSGYRITTLSTLLFHTLFAGVAVVVWRGALALP